MSTIETLGYERTRALLLAAGVTVLALTAVVTLARGVDHVEVAGVVLYLPVFVAAVSSGLRGGVGAGMLAAAVYVLLRLQGLEVTTVEAILPTTALRVGGYLLFGALGGWAAGVIAGGIDKLERHDIVDGASGQLNARGVLRQLDHELQRARRYGSTFSVVAVSFVPAGDVHAVRRDVGEALRSALRGIDDIGRASEHGRDRMLAVLPETGSAGAAVVAGKVADRLQGTLHQGAEAEVEWLTSTEDDAALEGLLVDLARVVAHDFPAARRA